MEWGVGLGWRGLGEWGRRAEVTLDVAGKGGELRQGGER